MRFLQAQQKDRETILLLYRKAIAMEGCTWSMEYPNEKILEEDLKRNDLFCIKEDNGEIVGVISIDADEEVEALSCWDSNLQPGTELARLAVKQEYQNQGMARQLLQYGMKELYRRGYKSVHFLVSKGNERAIRSYSKLKFQVKGECFLYGHYWWCYEKTLENKQSQ